MLHKWMVETRGGDDFLLVCVRVKECLKTHKVALGALCLHGNESGC